MIRQSLFLVLFLSAVMGCSSSHESGKPRNYNFFDALTGADSYSATFDVLTQERRVHSEFEPVMTAFATYWSKPLRESYVKEMAIQFRLSAEAEKNLAQEQLSEDESFFVFVLSLATREPSWNDLDKKQSLWRVTLENKDGAAQLDPERIEPVSDTDERARYFYKRMDSFGRTYRIRFHKEILKTSPELFLHISGPRGSVVFNFQNNAATP